MCILVDKREIAVPVYGYFNYRDEYQVLVNECARAMENHWDIESSNEKNESLLRSSKTSLIVCHDYDKLRKLLLSFGINEYILSYLGLVSLEVGPQKIDDIIKPHIFTNR